MIKNCHTVTVTATSGKSNRVALITSESNDIIVGYHNKSSDISKFTTLQENSTTLTTPLVINLDQYKNSYLNYVGIYVLCNQGNWCTVDASFS